MRVVVANVRGFHQARPAVVAAALGEFAPDVVLVTECGTRRRLRRFASALGMEPHHGSLPPFLPRVRNAVLVRPPLSVADGGLVVFDGHAPLRRQGAYFARVTGADAPFWAVTVHLGLRGEERGRHADDLMRLLGHSEPPLLVGGDLNAKPDSRVVAKLTDIGWDAWVRMGQSTGETFPSHEPVARIDYLFVSREVRVDGAMVPGGAGVRAASDHLPLVVDLTL